MPRGRQEDEKKKKKKRDERKQVILDKPCWDAYAVSCHATVIHRKSRLELKKVVIDRQAAALIRQTKPWIWHVT